MACLGLRKASQPFLALHVHELIGPLLQHSDVEFVNRLCFYAGVCNVGGGSGAPARTLADARSAHRAAGTLVHVLSRFQFAILTPVSAAHASRKPLHWKI